MELGGAYSDERLIELVRNRESLFDRTRPDYKDEAVKAAAWASISQILNMPPEDCQNRWVRLRERFGRELRTRQLGQSDDLRGIRRPWPLFNHMLWLRRFIQPRNRFSNNPARLAVQAAHATSSDHNIATTTNANYESPTAGALWAPLWVADENSVSAETVEDIKNAEMGDDEVLENATIQEDDLREDETTDPFWALNEMHGGHKRRDDNLDASLAASLISVSAALSGLARRIQEEKKGCSCSSGCDEEEFGRSIATLVRNLPLNRRMGVKARILAVLASETASAAQEESSSDDRHNANRDGQTNAK